MITVLFDRAHPLSMLTQVEVTNIATCSDSDKQDHDQSDTWDDYTEVDNELESYELIQDCAEVTLMLSTPPPGMPLWKFRQIVDMEIDKYREDWAEREWHRLMKIKHNLEVELKTWGGKDETEIVDSRYENIQWEGNEEGDTLEQYKEKQRLKALRQQKLDKLAEVEKQWKEIDEAIRFRQGERKIRKIDEVTIDP